MPLSLQVKLLRALQERRVRPVGTTESVPVDVQIISATHRDLEKAIAGGNFREDLYYRLNVVMLEIPPLRKRRDDIPLLVHHFLQRIAAQRQQEPKVFSPEALGLLIAAPWPGNVRQLSNLIEQTTLLSATGVVSASLVEKCLRDRPTRLLSYEEAKEEFERNYLSKVMQIACGNVSKAALLAKRNRTEFYRLLNRCQLQPEQFRIAEK